MKSFLQLLVVLLFTSILHTSCTSNKYLFTYFKGKGENGLHFAESRDGYIWKALAGCSSLKPQVGCRP